MYKVDQSDTEKVEHEYRCRIRVKKRATLLQHRQAGAIAIHHVARLTQETTHAWTPPTR